MGKHSKAIRSHAEDLHPKDNELRNTLLNAADHMEAVERQLRIAKKALSDIDGGKDSIRWSSKRARLAKDAIHKDESRGGQMP